jgi:glycosyltransferase involved in cell wall biosynthesis
MALKQVDFSVAIRTYNRADRLAGLLVALRQQTHITFSWEVVVVNNNSTDATADVVAHLAPTLPVPVRYVFEPRQGASFARARAIAEAKGTFVGFLDDDNLPAADWVSCAYAFGRVHPQAAAFGSQIRGIFEVAPPPRFERIAAFLPVVERDHDLCFTAGDRRHSNLVPPGAGLVIRRQAWLEHVPAQLKLKGPVGNALVEKGEDVEALLHLKKAGWEIWFHRHMQIYHLIAKERFERRYLLAFFRGIGRSRYTTRMVACRPQMRLPMTLIYVANDARKLLWHTLQHIGRQDLVSLCEATLIKSSLLSPLFTWRKLIWPDRFADGAEWPLSERKVVGPTGSQTVSQTVNPSVSQTGRPSPQLARSESMALPRAAVSLNSPRHRS